MLVLRTYRAPPTGPGEWHCHGTDHHRCRQPAHDFRRDFKAIAGLAVMLVVLTTICSGLLFDALLPGLGLASALALGAIISPTDAVAATSVGRRLGLPWRLLTILEGEGLVNDASSLVLLSSAVAATTGTVHLWRVGLDFGYAVAVAVGLVVGYANVRIRSLLSDPVLGTAVDPGLRQPNGRPYPDEVLDRVREAARTRGGLSGPPDAGTADPREQYGRLMLAILAAERSGLLAARSGGAYTSRTLSRAQRALDLAEAALQEIPDLADPESS
ncbi:MAG: cation:proton antiporter [Streptosporangiaceae bacterium]